jgi:hypothetical protein
MMTTTDLCNIFGNDVFIKLFADDVKIYMLIDNICDRNTLQNGLNLLSLWRARLNDS